MTAEKARVRLTPDEVGRVVSGRMDGVPVGVVAVVEHLLAERMAQAWEEGFDAGERDVFEHSRTNDFDQPCIPNPYRPTSPAQEARDA